MLFKACGHLTHCKLFHLIFGVVVCQLNVFEERKSLDMLSKCKKKACKGPQKKKKKRNEHLISWVHFAS